MVAALIFYLILPFSTALAGEWLGLHKLRGRPWLRLGLCLVLLWVVAICVQLEAPSSPVAISARITDPTDRWTEWISSFSLVAFEVCSSFVIGLTVGWRSWPLWLRRGLLLLGTLAVVAAFTISAAAMSGEL